MITEATGKSALDHHQICPDSDRNSRDRSSEVTEDGILIWETLLAGWVRKSVSMLHFLIDYLVIPEATRQSAPQDHQFGLHSDQIF